MLLLFFACEAPGPVDEAGPGRRVAADCPERRCAATARALFAELGGPTPPSAEAGLARLEGRALVEAGGLTCVRGEWTISLAHPNLPPGEVLAELPLADACLARAKGPAAGFVAVVHPEAAQATALAEELARSGPDPAIDAQAWALLLTPDGAAHELGEPSARKLRP